MRKSNTQNLGVALKMYFKALKIDKKMMEVQATTLWPKLMGPTIGRATERVDVYNGVMFIKINSAVVRSELNMLKTQIRAKINENLDEPIITDIVFK